MQTNSLHEQQSRGAEIGDLAAYRKAKIIEALERLEANPTVKLVNTVEQQPEAASVATSESNSIVVANQEMATEARLHIIEAGPASTSEEGKRYAA
jgi:hypothetical protein